MNRLRLKLMDRLVDIGEEVSSETHSTTVHFMFGLSIATLVLAAGAAIGFLLGALLWWAWDSAWTWVAVLVTIVYTIPPVIAWAAWPTTRKQAWKVISGEGAK